MAYQDDRTAESRTCPNCRSFVVGPYCSQCGQPKNVHRRTVVGLVHEFLADLASFDSRILHTAWALLLKPGELSVAFRDGRTQRYVPAVRLYLFVSLFFFLVLSAGHIAVLQFVMRISHDAVPTMHSMSVRSGEGGDNRVRTDPKVVFFAPIGSVKSNVSSSDRKMVEEDLKTDKIVIDTNDGKKTANARDVFVRLVDNPAAINGPLTEWIPRALFALLPVFALLLALFYRRQRKDFLLVDHLVFSLNYHSFGFVLMLLVVGLKQTPLGDRALSILLPGLGAYLLMAIRQFYRQNWFLSIAKTLLVFGFYMIFLAIAAGVVLVMGFIDA